MTKHILIEGMDGTGKTSLSTYLAGYYDRPLRGRFANPDGAATRKTLAELVTDDGPMLRNPGLTGMVIYDRHPIISEIVAGPILKGGLQGRFRDMAWVNHYRDAITENCVVIFCQPSFQVVQGNMDGQPDRVRAHALELYRGYLMEMPIYPKRLVWDYTTMSHSTLLEKIDDQL